MQEEVLSSLGLDVTITRREDATFAPNGYIYNVYFDGEMQVRISASLCRLQSCYMFLRNATVTLYEQLMLCL